MFFDFCQGKENHLIRKILGSILLFAMLVTAVPVMAAAEVTAPLAETETDAVDLHTLYVTEGLVSHFSVLGNAAVSADLETGVWQDRISGATATLGNKAYWERRADGSIGFDILYGVYENGKVTVTEDPAQPLATDRYAANATYAETRLGFGLALLPEDDFTVEYVAKYNPIYVATPEGEIARNKNGSYMELYAMTKHGAMGAENAGPADHIGFLSSFATERDGVSGSVLLERGSVRWHFSDMATPTGESPVIGGSTGGMKGAFIKRDGIHTYAIARDEGMDKNGALTAVYTLWHDVSAQSFKKSVTLSAAKTDAGRTYYDKKDVGDFYLSSQTPTDFYSVRIYNRTLSETEMAQNRTADLLYYYGISIPEQLYGNTAAMTQLTAAIGTVKFATDSAERAACVAQIETALAALKTATVPVHAYGSLVGNIETLSGVCVLPAVFADREVLAWQSGTVTHKSGTVVPVTEGMTLTAVIASAPVIMGMPTAYVTDKEAELGIRFAASFARAEYDALTAIFGAEGVRLGILVTPAQYVQMARGIFTREALSAMVTASGSTSGAAFVEIPMTAIPDAGDITVAGVLYHFHATTLAKNPAFAAIAFVDIDTDGDGTLDKTLYGDYNAAYSATAKATIAAARDTVPPLAQGWIDNLLATFGA